MKRYNYYWFWLSLVVIIADQCSKYLAMQHLLLGQFVPITNFFNLFLTYNTGAAFSFLALAGGWQNYFLVGVALLISFAAACWLLYAPSAQKILSLSLALILGGALSNLLDRIRLGFVIDFLDFHYQGWHWPIFNLADSAITIGAVLLGVYFLLNYQE